MSARDLTLLLSTVFLCKYAKVLWLCKSKGFHDFLMRVHTIKDIGQKPGGNIGTSLSQPCFLSHDFHFFHKPIVYGIMHLLYGVETSDCVYMEFSCRRKFIKFTSTL